MVKYAVTRDPEDPRSAKGLGFGITNFPPVLCAGVDRDATFYALILPVIILTEIGMTMLVFTFWDVRKVIYIIILYPNEDEDQQPCIVMTPWVTPY